MIDSGLVGFTDFHSSHPQGPEPEHLEGVPPEQEALKGHLPRVIYHQVHYYTKTKDPRQSLKGVR
jgi:hypothetical protein